MKYIVVMTAVGAMLAGCSNLNLGALGAGGSKPAMETGAAVPVDTMAAGTADVRPTARPAKGKPQEGATAPALVVTNGPLGVTVASLGNPAEGGLWLKTPLVKAEQMGRVSYNGTSATMRLIPIEGPATAGSRMSLQAFQALGAPLTDLVKVNVSL